MPVVNIYHDKYDVYIGRVGKGQSGIFGNPIETGIRCQVCNQIHKKPEDTIECFKWHVWRKINNEPEFREQLWGIRGQKMGCFCKPKPCHGDVLEQWHKLGGPYVDTDGNMRMMAQLQKENIAGCADSYADGLTAVYNLRNKSNSVQLLGTDMLYMLVDMLVERNSDVNDMGPWERIGIMGHVQSKLKSDEITELWNELQRKILHHLFEAIEQETEIPF